MFGWLQLVTRIALRNLFASGINLIIGAIIFGGTLLFVVGGSMLNSLDRSMSRSIIGSVAGHLQVYSAKSKDELSLYGTFGGEPDLSPMTNFPKVKADLLADPKVKFVVPMGTNQALITSGNTIDLTLAELRDVVRQEKDQGVSAALEARKQSLALHVQQIIKVLKQDQKNLAEMVSDPERERDSAVVLDRASSPELWASFAKDPYAVLEFLENKVAPLITDADMLPIRYVGTDLDTFAKAFDRLEIVDGQMVPQGHRGFLFSKAYYEEALKLKSAFRLDKMKEALENGRGRVRIATDPVLRRYVRENKTQTREILFQLDPQRTATAVQALQKLLGSQQADLEPLLVQFFDMDDANFAARYRFFYDQLAPLLQLYRLRIGDTLTIKQFTQSGFMQSVNVRIYGTYRFKGMGESPLAGAINLMDLVSFRNLYGYLSADNLAEIKTIQKEAGAQDIDRAHADEELFGASSQPLVTQTKSASNEGAELAQLSTVAKDRAAGIKDTFDPAELDQGMVPNAAVILKDPSTLMAAKHEIEQISDREHLGLKVMTWQQASGFLGQMVLMFKLVLYFCVLVTFIVALLIINNAMMMATLQRIREIGTIRAIGAQRGFVLSMVLMETVLLGLVFGALGAAVGSGAIGLAGHVGIPAGTSDVVRFFFSGPRLYPTLSTTNLVAAFVIILFVAAISTLYPAVTATRVAPVTAMQTDE